MESFQVILTQIVAINSREYDSTILTWIYYIVIEIFINKWKHTVNFTKQRIPMHDLWNRFDKKNIGLENKWVIYLWNMVSV